VKNLAGLDYIIIIVYIIASVAIGLLVSRGQKNISDFFVAGRSIGWFIVALTVIATNLSAISYMGCPEFAFREDLRPLTGYVLFIVPISIALVAFVLVRLLYRLQIITIYEYLEKRYGLPLRVLASLLFLCAKCGWLATVLYVPALMLMVVTGFPMMWCIVIAGFTSTLYSAVGGTKAVIWTDVMQFFVLVAGIVVSLVMVFGETGFTAAWQMAQNADFGGLTRADHTRLFDFTLSLTAQFTVWSVIAALMVGNFFDYGLNQIVVQRYFAAKSVKDAVLGVVSNSVIVMPVIIGLYLVGVGLAAYYQQHPELFKALMALDKDPNVALKSVFPFFIVHVIPAGLAGLVIAGVLAATMSSVSSAVNSLTAVYIVDYYKRFFHKPERDEAYYLNVSRFGTLVWGAVATIFAMYVGNIGSRIVDILGIIYGYLVGPLVGIFLLGVLTKRANGPGVLIGTVCGLVSVMLISQFTKVFWQWYAPAGFVVTAAVGYILSLFVGARPTAEQLKVASPSAGG